MSFDDEQRDIKEERQLELAVPLNGAPLTVAEHLEAARLAREKRERAMRLLMGELEVNP